MLLGPVGCRGSGGGKPPGDPAAAGERPGIALTAAGRARGLVLHRVTEEGWGISGLAADPGGTLWAVPEQRRRLIALNPDGSLNRQIPLAALPPSVDTESLAWLSWERLAVGLETKQAGGAARVDGKVCDVALLRPRPGQGAYVERCLAFPYARFHLTPGRNHGIEGLCAAGGKLVAASETVIERDGERLAPLGVYDLAAGTWQAGVLRLSSSAEQKGKISALACATEGDNLRLFAVERHFKVSHLLSLTLSATLPEAPLTPKVALDLRPLVAGGPNWEGLSLLPGGKLALINDNLYGVPMGRTVLLNLDTHR